MVCVDLGNKFYTVPDCSYSRNKWYWAHDDVVAGDKYYGSINNAKGECNKYPLCIAIACENSNPGRCYLVKEKTGDSYIHTSWSYYDRYCGKFPLRNPTLTKSSLVFADSWFIEYILKSH